MADGFVQVNTNLKNEDVWQLDRMMVEDGFDNRSAFIRRLVRQEFSRRHPAAGEKEFAEAIIDTAQPNTPPAGQAAADRSN